MAREINLYHEICSRGYLDGAAAEYSQREKDIIDQYPLPSLLTIFQKVCDAVAFAHSKGVVHRDLKPDNIMIGNFGEVLLMDWGLAKVVESQRTKASQQAPIEFAAGGKTESFVIDTEKDIDEETSGINEENLIDSIRSDDTGTDLRTISGRVMGTPGFMAPEQASPYGPGLTTQADIYSLGAILYSILVLRPPVMGITDLAPLQGMPLTCLYCDDNDIEDLHVLADMSLHTLHCGGNRIISLDALSG